MKTVHITPKVIPVAFPGFVLTVGEPRVTLLEPAAKWRCGGHVKGRPFVTVPMTIENKTNDLLHPWTMLSIALLSEDLATEAPKVFIPMALADDKALDFSVIQPKSTQIVERVFSLHPRVDIATAVLRMRNRTHSISYFVGVGND